jgi:HK97 family phage prohead protease
MQDLFLIIAGYASTFYQLDKSQDIILPQAFKDLNKPIPIFYGHRANLELGQILFTQLDDYGLYIEGIIFCDKAWQKALAKKVNQKSIKGLSVGIKLKEAQSLDEARFIEEAELLEISLTKEPVNPACQIGFSQFFLVGDSGLEPPTSTMSR